MPSDKTRPPCAHPSFTQERVKGYGSGTGDCHCDRCGELFTFSEVQKIEKERDVSSKQSN